MLSVTTTVLAIALSVSTAFAFDVVDKKGKFIGKIASHDINYETDGIQTTVIAKHGGAPYVVQMGREEIAGTHWLYYPNPDCTGAPGIHMEPDYRWDVMVHPSGTSPNGDFWIMQRSRMYVMDAKSVWIPRGDYRGETVIGCEPFDSSIWVTPVVKVGNLNTIFTAPFTLK